jgi:pimeloyl-ACP methyl ester carboxylesterase
VEAGRSVIAILHSYGGQVGSDAFIGLGQDARTKEGLSGGISCLIYLAGYAVPEGISMMDKVQEFGNMDLVPIAFDFASDDTCVSTDPRTLLVGANELPEDELDKFLATLVRWNGKSFYLPSRHAAWREIPVAYIYSTIDMTVPITYQKSFVENMEKAGRPVRTFELATGHCSHVTATAGVVNAVEEIANSYAH